MRSKDKVCAIFQNVRLGLWVLGSECGWLLGEGLTADRHLAALRKQRHRLRVRLASLSGSAPSPAGDPKFPAPDPEQIAADLELLGEDLARLEAVTAQRRSERLRALRARFPGLDWNV